MSSILNKAQTEAVEYTAGPLLIVAGAGTGKTTVITRKIAHLIEQKLARPEEILALTFTDKSAEEVRERVEQLLTLSYSDMQISTFHSFCQKIIENHGLDIGLSTQPKILKETDVWILIKQNFDKFDLDYYRPVGSPTKYIHELIKHFSKCKDELITPAEYLEYAQSVKLDKDRADNDEKNRLIELANAYHTYNKILLDKNALDFSDLIYYAVKLLETRKNIRQGLQERYKYILVDEFQDVNWSQYRLVELLAGDGANLTVVGDDDQSIYAFRGASVSNIMRFRDDYKRSKEVVLRENYRSGQNILDSAYNCIKNNNPDRLEAKLKIDKKLISKTADRGVVRHWHFSSAPEEVAATIKEILSLKKKDKAIVWDDFAILARANSNLEPFTRALEEARIPYEYLASRGLLRQPLTLDCVNYFKLLDNYHEPTAVYRLLRLPFLEFAEADMRKFLYTTKRKSIPYYEALKSAGRLSLSPEGVKICARLASLIDEGAKKARFEPLSMVLYNFLDKSGYLAYLAHHENIGTRDVIRQIYQLRQFLYYIENYERTAPDATAYSFMEHLDQLREAGDDGQLYTPTDTPDSVNVLTVHSAKGMEFKYVFVVNMVEQKFPARSKNSGIEVPVKLVKEQLPEGDIHYQEERRLFYVAATRAKRRLYFTSADWYDSGKQKRKISRFLVEAGISPEEQQYKKTKSALPVKPKIKNEAKAEFIYELPKTFSFSQVKSYRTCPYQYKLGSVLKLPMKNSHYFTFGNTIHNTLQDFYNKIRVLNSAAPASLFGGMAAAGVKSDKPKPASPVKTPALDELLEIYDRNWNDDWFLSKHQRETYYHDGKMMLKRFYKDNDGSWTIPVAIEGGFKLKIGKYILSGRIDRIDQLKDGALEIIDYKTGQTKEKAVGDDKDQLLIYQIVAATAPEYRNLGPIVKLTYYFLKDAQKTEFIGQPKDLEKVKEKIEKTIDKIHSREFTATPGQRVCKSCSYRDICEFRV